MQQINKTTTIWKGAAHRNNGNRTMIYVFTHVTDTHDYDLRTGRYNNKPVVHGRTLKSVVNWMEKNGKTDHWLWCNGDEFIGWIDYDYARCLIDTGKTFVGRLDFYRWKQKNPRQK